MTNNIWFETCILFINKLTQTVAYWMEIIIIYFLANSTKWNIQNETYRHTQTSTISLLPRPSCSHPYLQCLHYSPPCVLKLHHFVPLHCLRSFNIQIMKHMIFLMVLTMGDWLISSLSIRFSQDNWREEYPPVHQVTNSLPPHMTCLERCRQMDLK